MQPAFRQGHRIRALAYLHAGPSSVIDQLAPPRRAFFFARQPPRPLKNDGQDAPQFSGAQGPSQVAASLPGHPIGSSRPVFTDDLEDTCRSGKPQLTPRVRRQAEVAEGAARPEAFVAPDLCVTVLTARSKSVQ